jgi:hypothetical protein
MVLVDGKITHINIKGVFHGSLPSELQAYIKRSRGELHQSDKHFGSCGVCGEMT